MFKCYISTLIVLKATSQTGLAHCVHRESNVQWCSQLNKKVVHIYLLVE